MKNKILKFKAMGPLFLLFAQYTSKIVGPLVSLLVVRYLGPEEYGFYAAALAIVALLSFLPDFGLQQSALKISANNDFTLSKIIKSTIITSVSYSLITFLIMIIWLDIFDYERKVYLLSVILALNFFRTSFLIVSTTMLQIRLEYMRLGVWNLIVNSSQWMLTILAILMKADIYSLIFWPVFISFLLSLFMFLKEGTRLKIFRREGFSSKNILTNLVGQSMEFGAGGSMQQLYHRSDAAILSATRNPIEVGYFTVAYKITDLINFLPSVLFNQVLYPKLFSWSKNDREKYLVSYKILNNTMIFIGASACSFILLFSEEITYLIFGTREDFLSTLLNIMVLAIPFRFLASSTGAILTTDNLIRKKIKFQFIIAFVNVGLNAILIPIYGAISAALLMIFTDILLLLGYLFLVNKFVTKSHFNKKIIFQIPIILILILCSVLLSDYNLGFRFFIIILILSLFGFTYWSSLGNKEKGQIDQFLFKR